MSEPVTKSYSAAALVSAYRYFLIRQYGEPKNMSPTERDRFHSNVGIMVHFVDEQFEPPVFFGTPQP